MHWDATRPPFEVSGFAVDTGRLRPGVPIVRARGRLDRATVGRLWMALDHCLDAAPWAVVVDLTALSEIRAGAVPTLVDVARRAAADGIGLHFVTAGGAVDQVLGGPPGADLLVIHHSVAAAESALGRRS
jgi:ABC-type transporter Mla MlaB component